MIPVGKLQDMLLWQSATECFDVDPAFVSWVWLIDIDILVQSSLSQIPVIFGRSQCQLINGSFSRGPLISKMYAFDLKSRDQRPLALTKGRGVAHCLCSVAHRRTFATVLRRVGHYVQVAGCILTSSSSLSPSRYDPACYMMRSVPVGIWKSRNRVRDNTTPANITPLFEG